VAASCGACTGGVQRKGKARSSRRPSSTLNLSSRCAPAKAASVPPADTVQGRALRLCGKHGDDRGHGKHGDDD
jgi:hypothetical protein